MDGHTISLIASAITGVIMLLLGTISWFLRDRVKDNDQKMARLEERQHALEMAQVRDNGELRQIAKALESIGELRAELALRYVTREELAKMMSRIEQMRDEVQRVSIALAARGLGIGDGKAS